MLEMSDAIRTWLKVDNSLTINTTDGGPCAVKMLYQLCISPSPTKICRNPLSPHAWMLSRFWALEFPSTMDVHHRAEKVKSTIV